MSLLWLTVFCFMANPIQGFDIGRKLWKDGIAKFDETESELTNLGPDLDGRIVSLLSDELGNVDDENEAFLTDDNPDFADRDLPVLADRDSLLLDDELHESDDSIAPYFNQDVADPIERGWALAGDEQQAFEEPDTAMSDIAEDGPDFDKRNGLTIFDMFKDISDRLDAMQDQMDKLKDGKKLESCPDGWHKYGKSCYYFSRYGSDWFDAMTICEALQGYLAEINDYSESAYLERKVAYLGGNCFYVGGTDMIKENHWIWAHSQTPMTTSTFQDWWKGEPNDKSGNEHCLCLRSTAWIDIPCYTSNKYICERDLT